VRARSTEASNGSSASVSRNITLVALRGTPVATPPGRNPSVRYLNAAIPITATPPQPLRVSPLRPEIAGTPIRLPVAARQDNQVGDEAWIRSLSAELVDRWWDDKAGSKGRVH